jgi:WD40 repeat protein
LLTSPFVGRASERAQTELVAQLGHSLGVASITVTADDQYAITGSFDRTIRVWHLETGRLVRTLVAPADAGKVFCVDMAPDDTRLASGHADGSVILWDPWSGALLGRLGDPDPVATGQPLHGPRSEQDALRRYGRHAGILEEVRFSLDGALISGARRDGSVWLWDAHSRELLRIIDAHEGAARAVSFAGTELLTVGDDQTTAVWKIDTGEEVQRYAGHGAAVVDVAVAQSDDLLWTIDAEGKGLARRARDGTVLCEMTIASFVPEDWSGAFWPKIDLSPDGSLVALGSMDGSVYLVGARDCQILGILRNELDNWTNGVAFTHSGRHLLNTGWFDADPTTGYPPHAGFNVMDVQTLTRIGHVSGAARPNVLNSISDDGSRLLVTALDSPAMLWNLDHGELERTFPDMGDWVVLSSDGMRAVGVDSEGAVTRIWDVGTGRASVESRVPGATPRWAGWLDGENRAWTFDSRGVVSVWRTRDGEDVESLSIDGDIRAGTLSPSGSMLAVMTSEGDGELWDVQTGSRRCSFSKDGSTVYFADFSSDGQFLVSAQANGTAIVYSIADCHEITVLEHVDPAGVLWAGFTPDDRHILTSTWSGAYLWNAETGDLLREFTGHTDLVASAAYDSTRDLVVTASVDGTSRIWEASTGNLECTLIAFHDGTWGVVDASGRYDSSGLGEIEGLHWIVDNVPVELWQLKERYYEPGLLRKILDDQPLRDVPSLDDHPILLPPDLHLSLPTGDATVLGIEVFDSGGGVGRIQVLVNGKEMIADARGYGASARPDNTVINVDLKDAAGLMPGKDNVVQIIPWNQEGYLRGRGAVAHWRAPGIPEERPPELWAIVSGISDYQGDDLDLRFASQDATHFAQALEVGAKRLFGPERVHLSLLADTGGPLAAAPTATNLRAAFDAAASAAPEDILVVFLAGHGVALPTDNSSYAYLTAEARTADPEGLRDPGVLATTAIVDRQLAEWMSDIPALKQVLVLDTCAAAAATERLADVRAVSGDQVRALERLSRRTGLHLLMGSASDRVSYEASRYGQGLLTYSLLEGMRGAALRDSSFVDVSRLFQYAADRVPVLATDIGGIQRPEISAPRGTSFDIGQITVDDRSLVPLSPSLPILLRPAAWNSDAGFDDLGLGAALQTRLVERVADQLGGEVVAIDAEEMPGGIRTHVQYKVRGGRIRARITVVQDRRVVVEFPLVHTVDELDLLTDEILSKVVGCAVAIDLDR